MKYKLQCHLKINKTTLTKYIFEGPQYLIPY